MASNENDESQGRTSSKEAEEILAQLQEYWTPERRENATPKPMPVRQEELRREEPTATGEPSFQHPHRPEGEEDKRESAAAAGCPATKVTSTTTWPNCCNGKLFFDWKGQSYVGSAGSITLEVILTAGHCVYDEGEWSTNFLYYPAYPDLGRSWSWKRAAVFKAWQTSNNYAYDYAMLLTSSSMAAVGSWGWVYNLAPSAWKAFGYPGNSPYPGNQMYQTSGAYVGGSPVMGMNNNDMHSGSSGGNWIATYQGQQLYANGVNSHHTGTACVEYSPYFDESFANLLKCVTTGVCS